MPQTALALPALVAEQMTAAGFHILELTFLRQAKPFRNRFLRLMLHISATLPATPQRAALTKPIAESLFALGFPQIRNGAFYVRNPAASSSFK